MTVSLNKSPGPTSELRWSAKGNKLPFAATAFSGIALCLAFWVKYDFGVELTSAGLVFALLALSVGVMGGLSAKKSDPAVSSDPVALFSRDYRAFRSTVLVCTLSFGLPWIMSFWAAWFLIGSPLGWCTSAFFSMVGAMMGLVVGRFVSVWPNFFITQIYLAMRHGAPRDLMSFLQDACHRGVLRQMGAVYQLRHIDLQRHLAQQPWPPVT
ncbi:hypothetical protein L7D48_09400 [Streptomyces sp. S1A]|uniref:hypothetical protein n=1 Tax=Streptomyces sp. ICN903 TaxID=2964654 RepID=UPI001EDC80E0|nr:hypothetical protein [Streptomyces sp. ICN903]MCG3040781.1 hypothetical protein [Streptomyces sp. ICN903]